MYQMEPWAKRRPLGLPKWVGTNGDLAILLPSLVLITALFTRKGWPVGLFVLLLAYMNSIGIRDTIKSGSHSMNWGWPNGVKTYTRDGTPGMYYLMMAWLIVSTLFFVLGGIACLTYDYWVHPIIS